MDKVGVCCLCQKRIPSLVPVLAASLFLHRMVALQQYAVVLGSSVPGAAADLWDPQMFQGY